MEYEVKVKYKNDILKGILINEDEDYILLKLISGYNANLKKSNIEIISKTKIQKNKIISKKTNKTNTKLPKITIIHTGGTIASKVDYKTGAVSSKFTPEEILNLFPELNKIAQIDAKMIRNMASDDMRFEHYNIMIEEIEKAIKLGSKGVIISHGTDTLHYTSAALQYALKNLPIPVILVGAQRSSDRPSSDAYSNLEAGVKFILHNLTLDKQYMRVGICMHNTINDSSFSILDGINAKKLHSSRRDAFRQINYPKVAEFSSGKVTILRDELFNKPAKNKLEITKYDTKLKIGFLKIHPHMFAFEVDLYKQFDAVIVEGTGLGHLPISKIDDCTNEHLKILESLNSLIKYGIKIIIGLQTVYGEVNLNVYSPGRVLNDTGVYGNKLNLTTESLFMRSAHILSSNYDDFDMLWNENLESFEIRSIEICDDLE